MPKIVSKYVQVHVATVNKNTGQTEFLLLKRSIGSRLYPGLWQVITGTIEAGESALRTAVRELKEETGFVSENWWTLPFVSSFYDPLCDEICSSPVFGVLIDEASKFVISDEHSDFQWLSYQDTLINSLLPGHKQGTEYFQDCVISKSDRSMFKIDLESFTF